MTVKQIFGVIFVDQFQQRFKTPVGDVITVTFGNRPVSVKVVSIDEPRGKDVAREMYEIIDEGKPLAANHGEA